nr:death-inducer obliterator 1-like [Ipomoea batatas]
MSSDLVSQQFPDRQLVHMDQVPDKQESSVSGMQMAGNMPNNIPHEFPVSNGPMNPVESVPGSGNRFGNSLVSVHQFGQMEYRTGVQSSSLLPGSASHQFVLSNQQGVIRNMPTNIDVQKLSVPSKRKAEAEPLLHGSPQQSSLPNKRATDAGSFSQFSSRLQHSLQNKKTEQVQPKVSPTASQALPASSRKIVRNESLSNRTGPQRAQAPKGRAIQVDPISKNQTVSFNAVRSKMRESLAGALALACKRKVTTSPAKDENEDNIAQQLPADSQTLEGNLSSNGACSRALQKPNDAVPTTESLTSGKPGDAEEFSIGFPANEAMQVSGPGFNGIQCSTELAVEDIPFSDNFFVKDELLQGNGLSWVMDLEMEAREMNEVNDAAKPKLANEDENEGSDYQTKESPEDLAFKIEAELFKLFGGVNKKYKEKGRSLLFNLKDPNNPELRERVMSGEILPERLCSMTAEELASKELSEWRMAKAEEFAQMVVLPDNDADMRRLVKKTHKGEYQVEFERDDKVDNIAAEISAGATSITQCQRKPKVAKAKAASEAVERESSADKNSAEKQDLSDSLVIPAEGTDLMQGMMVDEFKEAEFLPPIVTLDEFMESLNSEPPFENLPVDSSQSTPLSDKEGTVTGIKARATDSTSKGPSNASEGKPGEAIKKQAEPVNKEVEPEAVHKSISNVTAKKASPTGNASLVGSIWEGALQLTISTSVTVLCYFRSGETTSMKEWPNSLEVKGRVRIDAFEKFLQELPMSRSRAVMVTQFVLKDKSSEDERNSLSEAVESYVSDNRLGFAEPGPGVELYLCPPNGRVLDMLIKHLSKDRSELHDSTTDNALIGVVVWRKHHISSTISPNSTQHHKHTTFKKQQSMSSRRPQEKDNNDNFLPKGSSSAPAQFPPHDDGGDDDDDDIPPGFGPSKGSRDDDDLPEFNFVGNMNASSMSRYPQPQPRPQTVSSSAPAVDQMRQLVQKYGQTGNNTVPGGFGIEPWNDDDDDDDIPEWRPQAPLPPPPNLRPPGGHAQGFHHHPPHLRMQTPHHHLPNIAPPPNASPRWPPPSGNFGNQQPGGQYYGSPTLRPGQPPGTDYRRDSSRSSRGF